jgi:hypothetical protein
MVEETRGKAPRELSSPIDLANRKRLLTASLGDAHEADISFERIIDGNGSSR